MIDNIYLINLINFLKSKKYRIGFVMGGYCVPYNKIIASNRIRVYDVIKMFFDNEDFLVELYNPLRKYDMVIFHKKFDKAALFLAKKLKREGTQIILDINVNYYDLSSKFITRQQNKDILVFTKFVDKVITPTVFLQETIKKIFPGKSVDVIKESINDIFFKKKKNSFNFNSTNLIWCGYAPKASELLLIKDVLKELYKKQRFNLILICDKNPHLIIGKIPIHFERYNFYSNLDQLLKGDIFIVPRNLNDSYNLAHTFTKIGIAMAAGLPVLASPLSSYAGSPAVLCRNSQDWKKGLMKLFNNTALLTELSKKGIDYVKKNYSIPVIKQKYINFFNKSIR